MAGSRSDRKPSTREIEHKLFAAPSFEQFLQENGDGMLTPKICYYLAELCRARGLKQAEAIRRSGLDRTYGYQLFNGTRKPSRDKLLQLAFGFGLTVEETQDLLRTAQKSALYPKILRDAAVMQCLYKGKSLEDLQALLSVLGLTSIGGGDRDE